MGRLADRAFAEPALRRAWANVLANDSADGSLTSGIRRFADDSDDQIDRIAADLAAGAYVPRDLTEIMLEADGSLRALHIPAVRDRVVERAVLEVVTPLVDPALGHCSYAYRPGLGVDDAVQAVARLRGEGLAWVLRTDVDDCFPSIPASLASRRLAALIDDADLMQVIDRLLGRMYAAPGRGRRQLRGLAQGCALSPLLANLILVDLDHALLDEGFPVVRYSDDIVVATVSQAEAWEAARIAAGAVEELGMALGSEDTQVMSFADGFTFLGEDFGPRYPPIMDAPRVQEPERKVLYAGIQGSRVRISSGRLLVESGENTTNLDVPTGHVRRIVCFGAVGVTAGTRSWAMSSDVDVIFASRRGTYLGSLVSESGAPRASRLRAQVRLQGTTQSMEVSRSIVEAKVRKQIVVLRRFGRREHAKSIRAAVSSMEQMLRLLPEALSPDELMGLEGAAAAAYFPAYGSLFPSSLRFESRSRQPPLDVANSALSFLYTVLLGECVTALHAAGLDPGIGLLHADHERRPSLALDLMEELRPFIVDQVVLSSARLKALRPEHGRAEEGRAGVLLTRAGREALIDAYERRMLTTTRGALPDFAGTLRRHIYRQAQRLQATITNPDQQPWSGMSWR